MEIEATYIEANGNMKEIYPDNLDGKFSTDELTKLVDGPVKIVAPDNYSGRVIVMNAEGIIKLLPINKRAGAMFPTIAMRGNVVLCNRSMLNLELKQLLKAKLNER